MSAARALAVAGAGVLAALATLIALAPAAWVAAAVRRASHEHLDLAEASGTLWNGQATLVLAAGDEPRAARSALPDRLGWQLDALPLLTGSLALRLTQPALLDQPLVVRAGLGGTLTASATTARLPAALLATLGAPWNTIRPGGTVVLSWDTLQLRWRGPGAGLRGGFGAEWQDAASALSPVSPLGHYRLRTNGAWPGTRLTLETVSGPLRLTGDGTIDDGGHLRFAGTAAAEPGADEGVKNQLAGLINLLGRRSGDAAILNFGS